MINVIVASSTVPQDAQARATGCAGVAGGMAVAFSIDGHAGSEGETVGAHSHSSGGPRGLGIQENVAHTVRSGRTHSVGYGMAVRRLTPLECERLQGFSDNYTRIVIGRRRRAPSDKMLAKNADQFELGEDGIWTRYAQDGPRYKALGNSMAGNVMEWIGQGIQLVEELAPVLEVAA